MFTHTLLRVPRKPGLQLLHQRGAPDSTRAISGWRLRLGPGETATHRLETEEMIVVLQDGRGTFSAGAERWTVEREGVFAGRGTALYVPPGVAFTAAATSPMEAIIMSAPAPGGGKAALVGPSDVTVNQRGRGTYGREVHDLFVRDSHAKTLMVGETFNPPGHWSSYPPHKHDGKNGEPTLEEVYYYRVSPTQGFGQQMLYTADGEAIVHAVKDGDAVILPYGYHPVCNPPGYQLYYLWALAGAERKLGLFEDPSHTWIHDAPMPAEPGATK